MIFSCDDSPGQSRWLCLFVLFVQSSLPFDMLDQPKVLNKPWGGPGSPMPPLLSWGDWQPPCHPPPYPGSGPKRAWEDNVSSCGPFLGPATKRVRTRIVTRASSTLGNSSEILSSSNNPQASSGSAGFRRQQHTQQLGLSATPWDEKPSVTSDEADHTNESSCIPYRQCKAPNLDLYHTLILQVPRCQTTTDRCDKVTLQQQEYHVACIKALLSRLNKTCDQTFRKKQPVTPRILFQSMAWACG